ncbi:hypothetical protein K470DRAFT_220478 [Piedraia hortae CBS 480.64]|uniref:Cupin type-2 domain-containing protein n=1 Tax=Piedraia hortae CBS 480.64 TaxID=1314780 RepID=A0A6A7BVP0_9PEZI|nr:hypothetical protein K470DRAFT_220478 [Piedraia hortae CBS 480.64]
MRPQVFLIAPTKGLPASPYPLLHYSMALSFPDASSAHDLFSLNNWITQWVFRYGKTQPSHYHSRTHECMAVLSGKALIRFGGSNGQVLRAKAGDVFVIPAGVSHQTFDTVPEADFALLTPGEGRGIPGTEGEVRNALQSLTLDGFTMLGAYPTGGKWDFCTEEDEMDSEEIWKVPVPAKDPVVGVDQEGLVGLWTARK